MSKDHHAMIFLADMPFIHKDTIKKLLAEFDGKLALAPSFGGKRGHPLCLPSPLFTKASSFVGDEGFGKLLGHEIPCHLLECGDKGVLMDVDEKKDLVPQGDEG
jgi:Uncharacterized MobA-related protein